MMLAGTFFKLGWSTQFTFSQGSGPEGGDDIVRNQFRGRNNKKGCKIKE